VAALCEPLSRCRLQQRLLRRRYWRGTPVAAQNERPMSGKSANLILMYKCASLALPLNVNIERRIFTLII
jgi:hypothetical protein